LTARGVAGEYSGARSARPALRGDYVTAVVQKARRAGRSPALRARTSPPSPALAVAVASVLSGAGVVPAAPVWADAESPLAEIVVTARKRTESVQDVPQSIDVFSNEALQKLNIQQFEDYANRSPSISYISIGPGSQYFFMRGVADGSNPNVTNTSTTGLFLDDLSVSYYGSIPDLHMYDLERIEVLNGPQGTLFGAGSMSGAVRLITNKPDPSGLSGGLDADVGVFENGQPSYTYEGFLNLPLIDGTTAIRVSGFYVAQGGFIDNLLTTRHWLNGVTSTNAAFAGDHYNTQYLTGGRLELLHRFSDKWQITLSGDYQRQKHKGAWDMDPTRYGIDKVSRFGPEWGWNTNLNTQARVDGDVGIGDLVYVFGYYDQSLRSVIEYAEYVQYANTPNSYAEAGFLQGFACQTAPGYSANNAYGGCSNPYMYYNYWGDVKRWSNEVRLQSKGEGPLHWLVGGYQERTSDWYSSFYAMPGINDSGDQAQYYICNYNLGGNPCPTNGAGKPIYPAGVSPLPQEWYSYIARYDEHQYALFGDVDYALTREWTLTLGARWFLSRVFAESEYAGYFWNPKVPTPTATDSFNKWTFKAGISYQPSANFMYYFLFGQGFREGGFNQGFPPQIPYSYNPDTLDSYELGLKTTWAGGALRWNAAVYYMPWKNYQTALYDPAITTIGQFNANVGDARIFGVESYLEAHPNRRLSLTLSGSYNDSKLTSIKPFLNSEQQAAFPIAVGEHLPYVPDFKISASVRYEWPMRSDRTGYAQFDESYTDSMWSSLNLANSVTTGMPQRFLQPAYSLGTLRLGVSSGGTWNVEGYVNNIGDTHAVIYINTGNFDRRETTNPPRMYGLRLKYRFGKGG
jgi:outer membrane receptor protein involved in Fe transport